MKVAYEYTKITKQYEYVDHNSPAPTIVSNIPVAIPEYAFDRMQAKGVYEQMLEVIEWYKEMKEKQDKINDDITTTLKVEKDIIGENVVTRSFKIHDNILKLYNEFCYQYPKVKRQELIRAFKKLNFSEFYISLV